MQNIEEGHGLTPVEKVLRLQSVEIFKHASTEMLAYIGSLATEVRARAGETIFREGDAPDAMYVVVSGSVRLDKDGKEVLRIHELESFGTWALLDPEPRFMTAVSVEESHLLRIARDDFYDLLSDRDEITPVIFKAVIERIKTLMPEQRT